MLVEKCQKEVEDFIEAHMHRRHCRMFTSVSFVQMLQYAKPLNKKEKKNLNLTHLSLIL